MGYVTYSLIFKYITDKLNKKRKEIAEWLGYNNLEYISKIKSGDFKRPPKLNVEEIFNKTFATHIDVFVNGEQLQVHLYNYLKDNNALSDNINNLYNTYFGVNNDSDKYDDFIMAVLNEAENQANVNCKIEEKDENKKFRKPITLENFKNPIENSKFFGREQLIENVNNKLTQLGLSIICGVGGLGKSFCALKYADKYKNKYRYIQHVFFNTDIKTTLLNLKFNNLDEKHYTEREKLEARFSILQQYKDDVLLIIDNMNEIPNDKENYARLKQLSIHILITSRDMNLDSQKYIIPIKPLLPEEQFEFFKYHYECDIGVNEEEDFKKIFRMIDGHTLLLEMIAKTMKCSDMFPREMIKYLSFHNNDIISRIPIEKDNKYQQEKMDHFVSILFDTSSLNDAEKKVLMMLSLSSISGIRRKLFVELIGFTNNDIINGLCSKSWVVIESGKNISSFRVHLHPVISNAVTQNVIINLENSSDYLNNILKYLCDNDQLNETDKQDLCDILYNMGILFEYKSFEEIILLKKQADILWENLYYEKSLELYNKAINISDIVCDDCFKLKLYISCAKVDVRLAKYSKAIGMYQKAIHICKDNNILADLYNRMGFVYRKDSIYDEALFYLNKAKTILENGLNGDTLILADIYNNIGITYLNLENYKLALLNYENACKLREENPSVSKADLAYSYHNIGTVYQKQKNFKMAIEYHEKALKIREKIYTKREPLIAASLTMLGNDYSDAAYYENNDAYYLKAKDYFLKGIEIRKAVLGNNHPDLAWSYQSFGMWYNYQKDFTSALKYFEMALAIRENCLGENHAYTIKIKHLIREVKSKLVNVDLDNI